MNSSLFPLDRCCTFVLLAALICGAASSTSSENGDLGKISKEKVLSEIGHFFCDKTKSGKLITKTQMESLSEESWFKEDSNSCFIDNFKGYFISIGSFSMKGTHPVFHGCCKSRGILIAPDDAENEAGEKVKLVQFKDKKQCFWSDTCLLVQPCDFNCGCRQGMIRHRAAIVDPKDGWKWKWSFVKIPGCCKCIRNALPRPLPQLLEDPLCL